MAEEWGKWIEHDGRGCKPYPAGTYACIQFGFPWGGVVGEEEGISFGPAGRAEGWHTNDYPEYWVVLRYRIRKPRGLAVLKGLIADLPAPALDTVPREGIPA